MATHTARDSSTSPPASGSARGFGAFTEEASLDALRMLQLDDAGLQETLDAFTRLITDFLSVPVSLVSVVDGDRQVFLSHQGLATEPGERKSVPVDHSLCRSAVVSARPLVIADARNDPETRDHAAVRELGVGAYAGYPLVLADGVAIGAICAIDTEPHSWDERDLALLASLALGVQKILDQRAELVYRGLHDRLTGLPNRDLLVACCERMLRKLPADGAVAVVCAGVNHFNLVNQALGTDNADQVLQAVAQRLQTAADEGAAFGRLRGDVFALVTPQPEGEADLLAIADRVHAALSDMPLEVAGELLSVHATVGIATGDSNAHGADLISEAANAMRQGKRLAGRTRIAESDWTQAAAHQLRLREALRGALEREEISVAFQPVRELESGRVVAFEALARWRNEQLGNVSPADFIPLAELTADILPIGEFVARRSAEFAGRLRAAGAAGVRIGINVSPLQLERPGFCDVFTGILSEAGVDGGAVGIEITEGTLMEQGEAQADNLRRLQEAEVHIVLDDFGTGYSSLSYLREFPIETVKIDRAFVKDLVDDAGGAALIQAILAMARGMNMHVVAEGIETEEQAKLLHFLGCSFGQGFGLGRPAPADEAFAELRD